ncbi:hypothetical protein [Legionella drancourtii]
MKSKLPDFKELASMTGKLYNDIKTSVGQIIQDYKDIRAQSGVDGDTSEEVKPEASKPAKESKTEENQK